MDSISIFIVGLLYFFYILLRKKLEALDIDTNDKITIVMEFNLREVTGLTDVGIVHLTQANQIHMPNIINSFVISGQLLNLCFIIFK